MLLPVRGLGYGVLASFFLHAYSTGPLEARYQRYLAKRQVGMTEGSRRLQRFQMGMFTGTIALCVGVGATFDYLAAKKAEEVVKPPPPVVTPVPYPTTPPKYNAPRAA